MGQNGEWANVIAFMTFFFPSSEVPKRSGRSLGQVAKYRTSSVIGERYHEKSPAVLLGSSSARPSSRQSREVISSARRDLSSVSSTSAKTSRSDFRTSP